MATEPTDGIDEAGLCVAHPFGFAGPRHHNLDTVNTIRAMRDGRVHFFMAMGGDVATRGRPR